MNEKEKRRLEQLLMPPSYQVVLDRLMSIDSAVQQIIPSVQVDVRPSPEDSTLYTQSAQVLEDDCHVGLSTVSLDVQSIVAHQFEITKELFLSLTKSGQVVDFPLSQWVKSYNIGYEQLYSLYVHHSESERLRAFDSYTQLLFESYESQQAKLPTERLNNSLFNFLNTLALDAQELSDKEFAAHLKSQGALYLTEFGERTDSLKTRFQASSTILFKHLSKLTEPSYHPNSTLYFVLSASHNHPEFLRYYEDKLNNRFFKTGLESALNEIINEVMMSKPPLKYGSSFIASYLFNPSRFFNTGSRPHVIFGTGEKTWDVNSVDLKLRCSKTHNIFNEFALHNMLAIDTKAYPNCSKVLSIFYRSMTLMPTELFGNQDVLESLKTQCEQRLIEQEVETMVSTRSTSATYSTTPSNLTPRSLKI